MRYLARRGASCIDSKIVDESVRREHKVAELDVHDSLQVVSRVFRKIARPVGSMASTPEPSSHPPFYPLELLPLRMCESFCTFSSLHGK